MQIIRGGGGHGPPVPPPLFLRPCGYLFFWPFCSKKKYVKKNKHPYTLWKNAAVCSLQHSAVPIILRIFPDMRMSQKRAADKSISK